MMTQIWFNIGSCNGLWSKGRKLYFWNYCHLPGSEWVSKSTANLSCPHVLHHIWRFAPSCAGKNGGFGQPQKFAKNNEYFVLAFDAICKFIGTEANRYNFLCVVTINAINPWCQRRYSPAYITQMVVELIYYGRRLNKIQHQQLGFINDMIISKTDECSPHCGKNSSQAQVKIMLLGVCRLA